MAAPTIPKGEEYFFPIIYEGNGAGRRVGRFVPFTDNGTITNSVIFNRADNPYMYFNKSGITPDSDKKFTFSCWFKIGEKGSRLNTGLFNSNTDGSNGGNVTRYAPLATFTADGKLFGYDYDSGGYNWYFSTTRTFEDTSKWYHFVLAIDTTQSTSTDRMKIYIDGDQITSFSSTVYPALNQDLYTVMAGGYHILGLGYNAKFDGYIAEVNLIENQQLTPSTFGLTDTSTGRWIPKTLSGITYGTNGFRLAFADSSALGDDTSGNTKDFTATNLASTDQTTDSPSQNFPTFDNNQTIDNAGGTNIFSEGNLRVDMDYGGSGNQYGMALMNPAYAVTSGKYYWEHKLISQSHTDPSIYNLSMPGIIDLNVDKDITSYIGHTSGPTTYSWYTLGGYVFCDGTYDTQQYLPGGSTLPAIGDIINFALDMDNGAWYIGVNGTYVTANGAVGDPTSGSARTGAVRTFAPNTRKYIYGTSTQSGFNCVDEVNFGQKSFTHSIPTGYTKWQQDNVPSTDRNIPGMCWVKNRDSASWYHTIIDSSRGALKEIYTNGSFVEATQANSLRKFLKGGYQTGEAGNWNNGGDRFVSWNWVANNGTSSANSNGSIASVVQANQTAGFSIVKYSGNSGSAGTIGHGLSAKPEWIMVKDRDASSYEWMVQHTSLGATHYGSISSTDPFYDNDTIWNDTEPTSSVFSIGTNGSVNTGTNDYVAYVWHSVDGFSKFGSYSGNGDADGKFVYTGFTPVWIMVKRSTASGYNWQIWDTKRSPINPVTNQALFADGTFAEGGTSKLDILSNGFKWRGTEAWVNASSVTYVYMAFAEHPFVGDGTSPVTAR
jgi:hypothetical protein